MGIRYDEIGLRLKAFRMGSGLSADEIAQRIGISRTALYRIEKGELAKIETLDKLSELLGVSMPSLLGVGIEYLASAVSYFERLRQLEETAEHIVILAGPISFLLASEKFEEVLDQVLRESVPDDLPGTGFMIFRQDDRSTLSMSPFRLGENTNIRVGVAMVTSAPEAVTLHNKVVEEAWRTAIKGQAAADYLHRLLESPMTAVA